MTVSTTNSTEVFAGGQSVLTFNFTALTAFPQYIKVSAIALTGGTVTALSYGTQYTVTISTTGVGGTVIVIPTFGTNYNYVVYRQTGIVQNSQYTDYNAFPALTLMTNLDQLTMIEQEFKTNQGLTLSYPIGTSATYSTTFPTPSIGTVIGSDPTGMFFVNILVTGATGAIGPSGAGITLVSSSTTDISITSTVSSATITSVNAGTGGANTILRLNSSGNLPILNASLLTNVTASTNAIKNGNQLGPLSLISVGTLTTALTDGVVQVFSPVSQNLAIQVSSATMSLTNVGGWNQSNSMSTCVFVAKAEIWQVVTYGAATIPLIYWRPSGS